MCVPRRLSRWHHSQRQAGWQAHIDQEQAGSGVRERNKHRQIWIQRERVFQCALNPPNFPSAVCSSQANPVISLSSNDPFHKADQKARLSIKFLDQENMSGADYHNKVNSPKFSKRPQEHKNNKNRTEKRKERGIDVMKVVKGSDQRQYIAPCPGLFQSITGAEVKLSPGKSVSQAPIT